MRMMTSILAGLIWALCLSAYGDSPLNLTAGASNFEPGGYQVRLFTLTNTSSRPVYYDGYGSDAPIWQVDVQADLNRDRTKLENDSAGWCGMGLAERKLSPHRSVTLSVPVPEGSAWRLGIPYSLIPGLVDRPLTVWSPKLAIPSPLGERKDASKMVRLGVVVHTNKKFPYTFSLTNISTQTLYYGGYRDAPPLYINAYRHWSGWIDDGTCDWCGKGLGFQMLDPGQTLSFSIPAQNDVTWRIGLMLYRTPKPTTYADMYETVWWSAQPGRKSK